MSINLATYGLVSALAVGGAVAQHQYSQPAGPQQDDTAVQTQQSVPQDQMQNQSGYSSTPMGPSTGVIDCSTLMSHHQQMTSELDKLDQQADTLLSQMKDATSERAKLEATMGVVEALVTQRKQIRERMSTMEHETLQFVLSNKGTDLKTSCPQMTELLQQGSTNGVNTDDSEQGGADDLEFGNDR